MLSGSTAAIATFGFRPLSVVVGPRPLRAGVGTFASHAFPPRAAPAQIAFEERTTTRDEEPSACLEQEKSTTTPRRLRAPAAVRAGAQAWAAPSRIEHPRPPLPSCA